MKRFAAALAILLAGCVECRPPFNNPWGRFDDTSVGAPEFALDSIAGLYVLDGDRLEIATDGRWDYSWCGTCGTGRMPWEDNDIESCGKARVSGREIVFRRRSSETEAVSAVAFVLRGRLYLVGDAETAEVFDKINWGWLPERILLSRDRDASPEEARSFPMTPDLRKLILAAPVNGALVGAAPGRNLWLADVGSDDGVFVGMRLEGSSGEEFQTTSCYVRSCTAGECIVEARPDFGDPVPVAGMKLTCPARGTEYLRE